MAKYELERLGPERFEEMVKALLEQQFRIRGKLIQFSDGPDGGREATWSQPSTDDGWVKPGRQRTRKRISREWVFQAKYHAHSKSNRSAAGVLETDLSSELDKIVERHKLTCDTYVLITNVGLSGVRFRGSRDRLESLVGAKAKEMDFQIWDAADLSAMLDANPGVRQTYLDFLLPSDVLAAILREFKGKREMLRKVLRAYLESIADPSGAASTARTSDAGDDSERHLQLRDIYVDLTLRSELADTETIETILRSAIGRTSAATRSTTKTTGTGAHRAQSDHSEGTVPASLALLLPVRDVTLLLAGPGYGKSTLCQFAALFHATTLIEVMTGPQCSLASRLNLPELVSPESLNAAVQPRIPFRIELRRYASWLSKGNSGLGKYIASELMNPAAEGALDADDVFMLVEENPALLILDGLDEVPNNEARSSILSDLQTFLRRARTAGDADVQVLLSSRPQGYNNDFATFEPLTWTIQTLSQDQVDRYSEAWLGHRLADSHDRADARARFATAMKSPDVRQLATTLLQVTVMLSIARSRKDIPHERTSLFKRFVDVMFERERDKSAPVRKYERELRHLHATVAFRIHRQVEAGRPDGLSVVEFGEIAARTWTELSGDDDVSRPKQAVDTIVSIAQDRLVFLKGQGDGQTTIGFLLASYREYFAAEYLRAHERAERNKVFDALAEREAHWENVLRFYVGFQDPAVQVNWIENATNEVTTSPVTALIDTIRHRNLMLRLSPEFRDIQRGSFLKAVDYSLDTSTVWACLDAASAGEVVRSVRSGLAAKRTWIAF